MDKSSRGAIIMESNIFDKLSNILGDRTEVPATQDEVMKVPNGCIDSCEKITCMTPTVKPKTGILKLAHKKKLVVKDLNIKEEDPLASVLKTHVFLEEKNEYKIKNVDYNQHFDTCNPLEVNFADEVTKNAPNYQHTYVSYKCRTLRYPVHLALAMSTSEGPQDTINYVSNETVVKPKSEKAIKSTLEPYIEVDPSHFTLSYNKSPDVYRHSKVNKGSRQNLKRKKGKEANNNPIYIDLENVTQSGVSRCDLDPDANPSLYPQTAKKWEVKLSGQFRSNLNDETKATLESLMCSSTSLCSASKNHTVFLWIHKSSEKLHKYLLVGDLIRLILRCPKLSPFFVNNIENKLSIVNSNSFTMSSICNLKNTKWYNPMYREEVGKFLLYEVSSSCVSVIESCSEWVAESNKVWTTSVSPTDLFTTSTKFLEMLTTKDEKFLKLTQPSVGNKLICFVPANISNLFPDYVRGIGVVCQLFSVVFIKLFVCESVNLKEFQTFSPWIIESQKGLRASTILSKFEYCHKTLTPLLRNLMDYYPPLLNIASFLVSKFHLYNAIDRSDSEILFSQNKANLYESPESAKDSIVKIIEKDFCIPLHNAIAHLNSFKEYLDLLTKEESYFGAFESESEKKEYIANNCPLGTPFDQIMNDVNAIGDLIRSNTYSDQIQLEYNTCKSLASFFVPDNFKKCLVIVNQQLTRILDDLRHTYNQLKEYWISAFSPKSTPEVVVSSSGNVGKLIEALQKQFDQIELWIRSVYNNVFIFYSIRMFRGLVLYNPELNDHSFPKPATLCVPHGSKNGNTIPKNVNYQAITAPAPNSFVEVREKPPSSPPRKKICITSGGHITATGH